MRKAIISFSKNNVLEYDNIHTMRKAIWYRDVFVRVKDSKVPLANGCGYSEGAFQVEECEEGDIDAVDAISIDTLMNNRKE